MNTEEFRRRGKELVDYVANYMEKDIRTYPPLAKVKPGYLMKLIPQDAPSDPESFDDLMKDVADIIMPGITHWQSPHFHAYFPVAYSYPAICAEILSEGIGAIGFSWEASPAVTELETAMMDWLAKLLHLPEYFMSGGKGGGVIENSASEGVLMALLGARTKILANTKATKQIEDVEVRGKLVAYCSDQSHSSVERACLLGAVRCHKVTSDDLDEMRGEALEAAIKEDKDKGLIPFLVVATLGTTPCCSYDHLNEIGPVCDKEGVWLHVDAAYAGSAFICPEFRGYLNGVEFADSFTFNPHKLLLVNFGCSCLWYKDISYIVDAYNVNPVFLRHKNEDVTCDYRHWQISLGNRFRSLKLWFVIRLYGVEGLKQHIRKNVSLGKCFENLVKSDPRFVVTHKVTLGLVCFRLKDKANEVNAELLKRINEDGRIYLVPSTSKGKYFLRFCVIPTKTEVSDIEYAWKVIKEVATGLQDSGRSNEQIL